jgi:A/G-specific adenine glycosylase
MNGWKHTPVGPIRHRLLQWYEKHHRHLPWRETKNPYEIWVSEVMLQQTQVKTVLPYYRDFLAVFPDITHLANADLQDVLRVWEGLGYYARARNLHRAANVVLEKFDGRIPSTWSGFRKLPGVGDYIAAAVLSIAFDQPYAVVDGNVKRFVARLLKIALPVNKSSAASTFKNASKELLDPIQPGIFNQAMMELGATICKPQNPRCDVCPLRAFCRACQSLAVDQYPKRIKPKPIPEYQIAVGVVRKDNRYLITRRKPHGLLGGLWEFPGGKVGAQEGPERACVREIMEEVNLRVEIESHVTHVKHAYTHFRIYGDVFLCSYVSGAVKLNGPADYRWIALEDIDLYPFPKANRKFIPALIQTVRDLTHSAKHR